MNTSIIRRLEIYSLFDIGDPYISELYVWLYKKFNNLKITVKDAGILYTSYGVCTKLIFQEHSTKLLKIKSGIWSHLNIKFNLSTKQRQDIFNYIMYKFYGVTMYFPISYVLE